MLDGSESNGEVQGAAEAGLRVLQESASQPRLGGTTDHSRASRGLAIVERRSSATWGQHKGADDPCKIVAAGALPAVSTISRSSNRQDIRLLTGESWFESSSGSQLGRSANNGRPPRSQRDNTGSSPVRPTSVDIRRGTPRPAAPLSSVVELRSLTAGASVRFREGLPIRAQRSPPASAPE